MVRFGGAGARLLGTRYAPARSRNAGGNGGSASGVDDPPWGDGVKGAPGFGAAPKPPPNELPRSPRKPPLRTFFAIEPATAVNIILTTKSSSFSGAAMPGMPAPFRTPVLAV